MPFYLLSLCDREKIEKKYESFCPYCGSQGMVVEAPDEATARRVASFGEGYPGSIRGDEEQVWVLDSSIVTVTELVTQGGEPWVVLSSEGTG